MTEAGLTALRLPDAALPLDTAAAHAAFTAIIDGQCADPDIAAFLVALADRGETVTEVAAAAWVLRARVLTIAAPANAIDCCGTGGDGLATLNVSTAVAIVVAACGVPVAKHGNRAASSRSGAAEVLAELGVDTALGAAAAERCLRELGITFLHSAHHHAAMARVAAVRRGLGRRTIFNLLGPLANPAGVTRQLVGVFDRRWVRPVAEVLRDLGATRAMVVHGSDGMDELTVTGPSFVALLADGEIREFMVSPGDAGMPCHDGATLTGGTPCSNALQVVNLLAGTPGAYRAIVLLNAGAALVVAGMVDDIRAGAAVAAAAIDDGRAAALLARWSAFR